MFPTKAYHIFIACCNMTISLLVEIFIFPFHVLFRAEFGFLNSKSSRKRVNNGNSLCEIIYNCNLCLSFLNDRNKIVFCIDCILAESVSSIKICRKDM